MKIICFGDSNTYGYDPRSYFGGRYTADSRWVDILAENGRYTTVNYGQNGRSIPVYDEEIALYKRIFEKENGDMLIIMLGSNDLLSGLSIKSVSARMERLIRQMPFEAGRILLLAPPSFKSGSWVETEAQIEASQQLSGSYSALAGKLKINFADAELWNVELTHDGVHFSPRGHRAFAAGLAEIIEKIKEI